MPVDGQPIAVVRVEPSDSPPVRCNGRVYVRIGPTTRLATPEEERRLSEKRRYLLRPFDQQAVPGATSEDLDLQFFQTTYLPAVISPKTLAVNGRSEMDLLLTSRFLAPGSELPTVSGLLVIGNDPRSFFPGAYVQFVRFAGPDLTAPVLDEKALDGTVSFQAKQLDDLLRLQIKLAPKTVAAFRREETVDYPLLALREVVINALVHRNYEGTNAPVRISWFDDRVEFHSPGGLFGQVSPENFGRTTDYRNPTIAEAMKALGYIERFGAGIQRVYASLRENGNPEPTFDFSSPSYVLVTIWGVQP